MHSADNHLTNTWKNSSSPNLFPGHSQELYLLYNNPHKHTVYLSALGRLIGDTRETGCERAYNDITDKLNGFEKQRENCVENWHMESIRLGSTSCHLWKQSWATGCKINKEKQSKNNHCECQSYLLLNEELKYLFCHLWQKKKIYSAEHISYQIGFKHWKIKVSF